MLRSRIFIVATLIIAGMVSHARSEEAINWAPNLSAAVNMASRENRLVLLHFWAPGCGPCVALERNVFNRPEVAQAIDRDFVAVKINAQAMPDTARKYKVDRWPTDVIITPAGYPVHSMVSPQDPREYTQALYRVASQRRPGERLTAAAADARDVAGNQATQFGAAAFGAQNRAADQYAAEPYGAAAEDQASQFDAGQYGTDQNGAGQFGAAQFGAAQFGPAYANQFAEQERPTQEQSQFSAQGSLAGSESTQPAPQQSYNPYVNQGDPRESGFRGNDPRDQQFAQREQPITPRQPVAQPEPQAPPQNAQGLPPMGLEGYCPVTLIDDGKWTKGDKQFGIIHRGKLYLFVSDVEKQSFWEDPDRFAPILSGNDPVEFAETGRVVAGSRKHGVFFRNQIYLFISEESLQRFWNAPQRYADVALQAMARASERQMR